MGQRKISYLLIPMLMLVGLFILPTCGQSQCVTTNVYVGSATAPGPPYNFVIKYMSAPGSCTLTMTMNARNCNPGTAGFSTSLLWAYANTTAVSPSCQWACDCGTVTTDSSDGLPVELMSFSVEDEADKPETSGDNPTG